MLSAQKEETELAACAMANDLPNLGSFGKVVNSIQGLQERLENFSAEDVGNAHDKTQTLLLRLSYLQEKLATFVEVKALMITARDAIEQALRDCADSAKLDALENHARIQTTIQANKLIQFPRLYKLAKITAAQAAVNADESITTSAQVEENDASIPRVAEESGTAGAGQSPAIVHLAALTSQPPIESETATAAVVGQEDGPEALAATDLSPTTASDPLLAPELETLPADKPQIDACDSATSGSRDVNAEVGSPLISPASTSSEANTKDTVATTEPITDFDHRLLDDLIKNYGEFAASRSFSRTMEIASAPAVNTTEGQAVPSKAGVMEIEQERNNLPSIKRDGDLDQQLKKLIKDYGEYDLYSRQSPMNLKTGVIAAFLLLALIFSGFYYFSPRALNSQNSAPAQSRPSTSAGSDVHDNLTNRPGATVPEAGALRGTENNLRLKSRP